MTKTRFVTISLAILAIVGLGFWMGGGGFRFESGKVVTVTPSAATFRESVHKSLDKITFENQAGVKVTKTEPVKSPDGKTVSTIITATDDKGEKKSVRVDVTEDPKPDAAAAPAPTAQTPTTAPAAQPEGPQKQAANLPPRNVDNVPANWVRTDVQ